MGSASSITAKKLKLEVMSAEQIADFCVSIRLVYAQYRDAIVGDWWNRCNIIMTETTDSGVKVQRS